MNWYKKIIKKNKTEIISSAMFSGVFSLALLIWHFMLGKNFAWVTISPLSAPPPVYIIYSALVFVTLGRLLYVIGFYKLLATVVGEIMGDWKAYREIKAFLWLGLIIIAYYLLHKFIDLLNTIISFFYNVLNFILFLSPPLGISLILFIGGYLFFKKQQLDIKGYIKLFF